MTRRFCLWLLFPVLTIMVSLNAFAADMPDFIGLVEKYGPAVVNVQSTMTAENSQDGDEQDVPEIFRRFFGPGQIPRAPRQGNRVSMGSGFIISKDGYILTNNHVVEGADQVTVRLSDRRDLDAKVIGTDPQTDIALLKVAANDLPVVTLGDSKLLKPGQWVVALGSPFGFDHSVTHGIVSAIGRGFGRDQQYVPFIQTDVPINPGNSGGPLFNLEGQVVGINSQIFSNTGGYMGVSFAIPIDLAMNTVDQIKTTGHVSRGMIGVQIQGVGRAEAQSLGLPRVGGALVNNVTPGSAADKGGVHVGDVILAFNGMDIVNQADLPPMVGLTKPGTPAELSIFREGKTIKVPVVVGKPPADTGQLASNDSSGDSEQENALGIVVDDMTAEQRRQLGIKDEGVLVSKVGGIAAQRTPLNPGDIILMVGRKPVKTSAEFNASVKGLKSGDSVMLLVRRNDTTQFVAVTVPKTKDAG
ncbi:MAG: DegQ family serine endoprotease [Dokdonella sp.]